MRRSHVSPDARGARYAVPSRAMDREALLALVRRSTCIDLTCETLFCPDLGRPTAERPLDFVFRVAGGACTYFSPSE